ncbi:MAG: hypothetical protein A3E88_00120 [Legionellales bacterium RIFCSPHIGHO2_12_FULL_35_11]|nr:MAG: hypothetical protein A3E88_00120 [Legionellales bacterium RIFCSPHIGHO2_12_FULL_35_11]
MKKIRIALFAILSGLLVISTNSFAYDDKNCPEKSFCQDCFNKCHINPVQCPESCDACKGCLNKYGQ